MDGCKTPYVRPPTLSRERHASPPLTPNQDLREATGSEPLSLEAEYANQVSWRKAHDKLTFIVCKPIDNFSQLLGGDGDVQFVRMNTIDKMERMVGDVNFFLHKYDRGDDDGAAPADGKGWLTGEIDIMIADPDSRRKGMGRNAVCALLAYVQVQLGYILEEYVMNSGESGAALRNFMVKVKASNTASRALFEGIGFRAQGGPDYFGEVKLVMDLEDVQNQDWWVPLMEDWVQMPYGSMVDELKFMK